MTADILVHHSNHIHQYLYHRSRRWGHQYHQLCTLQNLFSAYLGKDLHLVPYILDHKYNYLGCCQRLKWNCEQDICCSLCWQSCKCPLGILKNCKVPSSETLLNKMFVSSDLMESHLDIADQPLSICHLIGTAWSLLLLQPRSHHCTWPHMWSWFDGCKKPSLHCQVVPNWDTESLSQWVTVGMLTSDNYPDLLSSCLCWFIVPSQGPPSGPVKPSLHTQCSFVGLADAWVEECGGQSLHAEAALRSGLYVPCGQSEERGNHVCWISYTVKLMPWRRENNKMLLTHTGRFKCAPISCTLAGDLSCPNKVVPWVALVCNLVTKGVNAAILYTILRRSWMFTALGLIKKMCQLSKSLTDHTEVLKSLK